MIKAVIFDCFGVFYTDPVFAYMRDPDTPPEKAEALHLLDKQAAVGALDKPGFVTQAAQLLSITEDESERRFFQSSEHNERLIELAKELRKTYKVALLSNIGGDMMDGFLRPKSASNSLTPSFFLVMYKWQNQIAPSLNLLVNGLV